MPVTLSIVGNTILYARYPFFFFYLFIFIFDHKKKKWQFMPVTLSIVGARSVNKKMAIYAGYPNYSKES